MTRTIYVDGKKIVLTQHKEVKRPKLMKGHVKANIKDFKYVLQVLLVAGSVAMSVAGYNGLIKTSENQMKKKNAIEFEENVGKIDDAILSLYIEQALNDIETEEKYASVWKEANELYIEGLKATAIANNTEPNEFDLYKNARASADECYEKAAVKLLDANCVFGYGPYEYYRNAVVNKDGEVLFEVSYDKEYGKINLSKVEDPYEIKTLYVNSKNKYIDAKEYVRNLHTKNIYLK